jgi:serine/threonine protein kinase
MPEWIGKTIGKVRIEKLLARGGMAEVYLGSHLTLDRQVAIKLLHSYIEEDPFLLERFQREAKAVAGLRHPNIVQIFDFDTADGHPYIVMEYLRGPTLATYLRHQHQRKKRIPSHLVARLLHGLTNALDYAHGQGVVHRDIKPGNIMLHNKTDEIPVDRPLTNDVEAIVADFGLVRLMDAASQTASGVLSGTPAYMSPEQARGDPVDHRTDIYSLGVVLYEMLAGRVPFEADSTLTVLHMHIHTSPPSIPGIAVKVQDVMDRALQKNPDDRYQTSREMAIDFYLSIGMTAQAEAIREPYPVSTVSIEAPAPEARPEPKLEPTPETKPEPLPIPEPKRETKPEPLPIPEPKPEPRPETKPEPLPIPEPLPEPKRETKPEPTPKPPRSRAGIPAILVSIIGLAVLAAAAYLIFSRRSNLPTLTETVSPEIPITSTSPVPSETPSLPPPTNMVPVAAGIYVVGKEPADEYHSASQSITLSEFWIDKYQVTNQDFQQFMVEWQIPPGKENHPVVGVKWEEADAYCQSLNKRLPGEAEWEAAGRGSGENPPLYPWGSDIERLRQLPNNAYEVGSLDFNLSRFEVYDMIGNVYEWVGEPYYDSVEAGKKLLRGVRASLPEDLTFRVQVTTEDTNYTQYAGFRCAASQVSE